MSATTRIPLESLRRRAREGEGGRRYWKSLEELAGTPAFREYLEREFPEHAAEWSDPAGRRDFLRLMGASMALAGVTACTRQPEEKIVPYVRQPEEIVPGKPLYYATALDGPGYASGVLVESHMGRPTKIEGNAAHPTSLGGTDIHGQAEILQLYDPDRSQTVSERGEIRSFGAFKAALLVALTAQKALEGESLRILTETVTSPSLFALIREVLAAYPKARWHQYEATSRDEARAGAELAFGEPLEAHYRLDAADVVLCLDADLVGPGPGHLRYVRELARRRKPTAAAGMNRIYVVESGVTPMGGIADHRLPMRASEIETFARALAAQLQLAVAGGEEVAAGPHGAWLQALARDLQAHPGRTAVIVGDNQPASVHALGHAINEVLGNLGSTVVLTEPVAAAPEQGRSSLAELTSDMQAGKVDLLLVLGGNPVYTAPADVPFAAALEQVNFRAHLGLHDDETSERCDWHVPAAHALESWGDVRAFDGTVSIQQPLIAPLYGGHTPHEVLLAILDRPDRKAYDAVRDHWRGRLEGDFETSWRRALHDGVVPGTAAAERSASVALGDWALQPPPEAVAELEVVLRADAPVHDGRYANNGWLQELPHPVTKVTWDNVAVVSPVTAQRLGIAAPVQTAQGHEVQLARLGLGERSQVVPVWIQPGQPDDVVGISLGYGRRRAGRVGDGVGFDATPFRTLAAPWFSGGARLEPLGATRLVACTQDHWTLEHEHAVHDRHIVRSATLGEYREHPERIASVGHEPGDELSFYDRYEYKGHAWGMAIDMSACVGCNACVVACQAENNIPVVGRDQVGRGREMQWIRIDRYYSGGLDNPEAFNQPMLCQHCENAPCEVVCPVAATVHSDEGLNDMVYNRCVGTRYCSNNCPYKVRRFNFFLYQDWETPSLKLQRNPDVTVRSRGVMEKCSYCVQRINQARIEAKNEGREIRDGDIQTACQQSCPAEAIVFGDLNDPESAVSRLKSEPRNYGVLADLGTRPRTTYLATIRNPNPELASEGEAHG